MYGSSAFSFYQFISGQADEFIYCEGSKIWDYFTGLRLTKLINTKLEVSNKKWMSRPGFKMNFKLKWN